MSDTSRNPANVAGVLRPLSKTIEAAYTRPADTTAYAAGDVVANSTSAATILTFSNMARALGLGGVIQNAALIMSTAAATKLSAELFLFDTAPTMQNDNAAFAPSDSELDKCLGVIVFDGTSTSNGARTTGNGCAIVTGAISLSYQCAATAKDLYGVLVARNAYTPGNAETLRVRLGCILD